MEEMYTLTVMERVYPHISPFVWRTYRTQRLGMSKADAMKRERREFGDADYIVIRAKPANNPSICN